MSSFGFGVQLENFRVKIQDLVSPRTHHCLADTPHAQSLRFMILLLRPWGNLAPGTCVLDGATWVLTHLFSGGDLFSHL